MLDATSSAFHHVVVICPGGNAVRTNDERTETASGEPTLSDIQKCDAAKLHAEINQLGNQKFLVTGASVTIFAVMFNRIFPILPDTVVEKDIVGALTSSIFFNFIAVAFVGQAKTLHTRMRAFTTYLDIFKLSNWERDWRKYRDQNDIGSRSVDHFPNLIVFLSLLAANSIVTSIFSFVLYRNSIINMQFDIGIFNFPIVYLAGFTAALPWIVIVVLLFIVGKALDNTERSYRNKWKSIKSLAPDGEI